MSNKTSLYLFGVTGRMGTEIRSLLQDSSVASYAGGTSSKGSDGDMNLADVFVDFSVPAALETILNLAISLNKPLIVGTTGLTKQHLGLAENAAQKIPVLVASNTSFGVAVMKKLSQLAATLFDESYDIEITEAHHRNKLDAPSGTALILGTAIAQAHGRTLDGVMADIDRSGHRQEGQIGFSVQRGGGVFGDHTVRFMGDDEIFELSHKGLSRRLFARGAINAAKWLKNQPAGLYDINQAFSLSN